VGIKGRTFNKSLDTSIATMHSDRVKPTGNADIANSVWVEMLWVTERRASYQND